MSVEVTQMRRDEEIDLGVLIRMVWQRKWLVIGVALGFAVAAAILALTATEIFKAEVELTEVRDAGMGGGGGLANQLGGLASLAGMQIGGNDVAIEAKAVLMSRRLVEEFIKRYDLVPVLYADMPEKPSLWYAVRLFRQKVLEIRDDSRKNTLTVSMEWRDPNVSSKWANDFVALANELVRTRKLEESQRNLNYLNGQLEKTSVLELRRVLYNLIETETKTQMLANGRIEYAFTVVDPAVPAEVRNSPRRTLMVILGTILGGIFAVLGVLAHNLWFADRRTATRNV
jgi:uncharacterized protein involved in exopolysaccharide biosynthesis